MKYYGFVYEGNIDIYKTNAVTGYDDPYTALELANQKWDADPDKQVSRLLVVVKDSDLKNSQDEKANAYFQFTDSKACKKFIENRNEIQWSSSKQQQWNGNATMMR